MNLIIHIVMALQGAAIIALALGCLWQSRRVATLEDTLRRAYLDLREMQTEEATARLRADRALQHYLDGVAYHVLPEEILRKVRTNA